jgi:hypothetical protein
MVKSLIETYKTLKEAGGASGGFVQAMQKKAAESGAASAAPKPVDAKAQGFPARPAASPSTSGTSTAFGGRPVPSNAINNLGRVSQRPEARPMPMGGSVPGRQVNSTMMAAKSQTMQGRPAGSPTQSVNVNRPVTSTGNPNVAGGTAPVRPAVPAPSTGIPKNRMDVVRQAQQQRKQDARISAVSRPGGTTPTQSAPRPGDKVPGEKVATNSELTGQAMARKGFGNDTGGGNYPAARSAAPAMSPTLKTQMDGKIGGRYDIAPNKKPLAKPADQPYNMKIPTMSPTLKTQMDGKIGGRYDIAPNKKPLAKPADQPYNMKIPTMSPTLKTQMDGKITDRKPAEVAAAEPNGENPAAGIPPKPTLKPTRTAPQTQTQTKKPGVVKKPNVPVKLARKPQAAGTQNNMTPAQRAQQNRRVERGNARPGEKTIGLGIKTGKVTGSTARSKRPIGSSQLKEGMLNNKQLAEMIKTLYKKKLEEQNPKAEASSYRERQQFKPVHVSDPYNKKDQSPNDYMHRMAEGMQQSTLGPDRSKKMNVYSSTLGNLKSRLWGGNQSMDNRYESAETDLGSTETGKKGREAETVSVNPKDTTFSATDPTNKNTTTKETKEK